MSDYECELQEVMKTCDVSDIVEFIDNGVESAETEK